MSSNDQLDDLAKGFGFKTSIFFFVLLILAILLVRLLTEPSVQRAVEGTKTENVQVE